MAIGRNARKCQYCKWIKSESGLVEVPYEIHDEFSDQQRATIERSLKDFHDKTCLRFVPRTDQKDYIHFRDFSGCWSYVGRTGGGQSVSLSTSGCVYKGVIQHEVLHALGFHHEQNRSDRDKYVRINWDYIKEGHSHNFKKKDTNNLNTKYDYRSIMHYHRYGFTTTSGKETITPIPDPDVKIGGSSLTETDILKVNRLYACADTPEPPRPPLNLTGKAFTFGEQTADSYVKLQHNLSKAIDVTSVCLRYFSDIPTNGREQSFFSLATPSQSNSFLVCKKGLNRHQLYVGGTKVDFWGLPDELNQWNSMCATWESGTGLAQVWLNGKPSARKSVFKGKPLTGVPVIALGQDQDGYGGWFNKNDALIGRLTDVHMWDRVISPCEIKQFAENELNEGGNVINWQALSYTTYGNAIEESQVIGGCAK